MTDGDVNPPLFFWPPPRLEPLQGELWRVTTALALAGMVLVLPLLWSMVAAQPFYSLGPLAENWKLALFSSLVRLAVLLAAWTRLFLLLRGATRAAVLGFSTRTIAEVMSDGGRDAGLIHAGAGDYGALTTDERQHLLRLRVRGAVLYCFAALSVPLGYALAVLLALNGATGRAGLWLLTLLPATIFLILGLVARRAESGLVREARRRQSVQPPAPNRHLAIDSAPARATPFRMAAIATAVLTLLVVLPLLTVVGTAAVGPYLAQAVGLNPISLYRRFALLEPLRMRRPPADSRVEAEAAGRAFHALMHAGRNVPPGMLNPRPAYPPWFADSIDQRWGLKDTARVRERMERAARRALTPEERAVLAPIAAHPAHAEFAALAAARRIDLVKTRYRLPFDLGLRSMDLPMVGSAYQSVAAARVAKATYELDAGQTAGAEQVLQETIGAGLLLADDAITLLDALGGTVFAGRAARALLVLLQAHRPSEALQLQADQELAARVADRLRIIEADPSLNGTIARLVQFARDPNMPRPFRWEMLYNFAVIAPCVNLHKAIFGPEPDYYEWIAEVKRTLVRSKAEAELFDLIERGLVRDAKGALAHCREPVLEVMRWRE